MSEFQIICPHCSQTISCDEQWAGQQIQCPLCQGALIAPQLEGKPKTKPSAPGPKPSSSPGPASTRPGWPASKPPSKGRAGAIVKVAVTILLLAAGIYFAWPYLQKLQGKFSASVDTASQGSDGGQVGHIASVYATLDATDPTKYESISDRSSEKPAAPRVKPAKKELPVIAPVWALDSEAQIPKSKLNGMVAGTNFLADTVRFDKASSAYVLDLRQGTNAIPDRQIQVILRLKPGQKIETNSWTVTKDLRAGIPQVVKKWKTGPRSIGQKAFSMGYAMKLELGEISEGVLPGKIYLALPDPEQTVIAGEFEADTHMSGAKEFASP